jgi:ribosome-associated toxin RatA of RatAB toxin-antitoxin module
MPSGEAAAPHGCRVRLSARRLYRRLRIMITRFALWLLLACAAPAPALAQRAALEVGVERVERADGHVYEVNARGEVAAAPAAVWRILTDYERMPEFVPDLRQARVLSRSGDQALLEQLGEARFLFFRRDIRLVVQVREQPISQIDISLVDGDMRVYNCSWRLVPLAASGGTRLLFTGSVAPKFYVPGMLGANLIRADIEKMMAAVMARLDRPS